MKPRDGKTHEKRESAQRAPRAEEVSRTPRRKARCLTATRGSRRCPSAASCCMERRGEQTGYGEGCSCKVQARRCTRLSRNTSQTKGESSRRETRRGRREPPLPLSAKTAHKGCAMDGADAGTRGRRDGAEVRQRRRSPPLSPGAKRRGTHARTRRRASDGTPGVQGLDEVFSYPEQVDPASSCGKARARTRGNEPSDGARGANENPCAGPSVWRRRQRSSFLKK